LRADFTSPASCSAGWSLCRIIVIVALFENETLYFSLLHCLHPRRRCFRAWFYRLVGPGLLSKWERAAAGLHFVGYGSMSIYSATGAYDRHPQYGGFTFGFSPAAS
jgi:hypothetical protein